MGRLSKPTELIETNNINISGDTIKDVYVFIDEYGNVTQIEKKDRDSRLKFYIDPTIPQTDYVADCVIGVSDSINGDCSYGIGLGVGDNQFASIY